MVTTRGATYCAAIFLVLITVACTDTSPVSPTATSLPQVVYSEWEIAQKNVETYVGERAHSVSPELFLWKELPGKLPCPPNDEPRFSGCFHPNGVGGPRIEWDRAAPSILHHESGHAILWALQDPRWDCFEHDDPADPNYEPACTSGVRR